MRHALLTEQWFPAIGGSIQLFDALYARAMPAGDSVHIIAGGSPGDERFDLDYPLPVARFDAARYTWLKPESTLEYTRMAAAAMRVCARERIEVLHCARVIPEAIVGAIVQRALGTPYVVWVHGEEVAVYQHYAVKKRLMPRLFAGAKAVIANSSHTRILAARAGALEDKLHVVNPAVDAALFAGPFDVSDLVARWNLADRTVLLTVGRLSRRKGHDVMLGALARLRAEGALGNIVWVVLSDGELEAELRARCTAAALDDVVRWVGPVAREELPRYYHLAQLFVMPNRTLGDDDIEGFGMVFLEASAAGVPVIGGRSGGVSDAIRDGETGLLVDGASVAAVAEAIVSLTRDRARARQMGDAGRAWTASLRWQHAARRVRAIAAG
jgi:phosphatidylinositol alpha-1,6-mannosyltransferase